MRKVKLALLLGTVAVTHGVAEAQDLNARPTASASGSGQTPSGTLDPSGAIPSPANSALAPANGVSADPQQPTGTQAAVTPLAAGAQTTSVTEDIVVTASRTETLASKTPITLTAVTGQKLAEQHITSPTGLMDLVPNLTIDRGNANGLQINIRGVTSTGTTSPSAAFLVDGIYIQQTNAQEVSFFDLERVEVLRGPQGTLYGRNTTAGVVNLISTTPKQQLGVSVDASVGNYGARQVTAVLNVPATDTLAFRLAGNWDQRDSYYTNIPTQTYALPPDKDNKSVRLSGLWKPNAAISLLLKLDYTSLHSPGSGFGYSPVLSNFYQTPYAVPPTGVREPDPAYLNPSATQALNRGYADAAPFNSRDSTFGVTGEFNWHLSDTLTFTTLDAYREFRRNDTGAVFWGTDYTTTPPTNMSYTAATTQQSRSNSEEGRLAFDNGPLKIQGGIYHFYNHDQATLRFNIFSLPNPGSSQNSFGVFGQSTYAIVDRWRVTGGIRYTKDDVVAAGGLVLLLPPGPLTLSDNYARGSSSKITWKAGTDFDITSRLLGYVTVATGYKATGFNGNCNTNDPGCQYKPESLTDYEGGVKGRFLDNALTVNASYFHYAYRDLQISQIVGVIQNGVSVPSAVTTNAARARVDGVELEGGYRLNRQHRLDFTAAYLNAKYEDYPIQAGSPTSGNYRGENLDHAPRWAFTAGYTFTQPLASGGTIVAGVHTRYSDKYYILNSVLNTQFGQPSFTRTDLTLRYAAPGNRWYLEGFAKNVENGIQVTYINTSPGYPGLNNGTVSTDDPRTYGVRAGFHF